MPNRAGGGRQGCGWPSGLQKGRLQQAGAVCDTLPPPLKVGERGKHRGTLLRHRKIGHHRCQMQIRQSNVDPVQLVPFGCDGIQALQHGAGIYQTLGQGRLIQGFIHHWRKDCVRENLPHQRHVAVEIGDRDHLGHPRHLMRDRRDQRQTRTDRIKVSQNGAGFGQREIFIPQHRHAAKGSML
ncbi:MAG: hypothetical protein ACI80I_001388 [Akkermansiaceae bacterium]|jgi:hypothetical protein